MNVTLCPIATSVGVAVKLAGSQNGGNVGFVGAVGVVGDDAGGRDDAVLVGLGVAPTVRREAADVPPQPAATAHRATIAADKTLRVITHEIVRPDVDGSARRGPHHGAREIRSFAFVSFATVAHH